MEAERHLDGDVVWTATYGAFGNATVDPASTVASNLRFPGQYFDEEAGIHYNRARYYNPKSGRFISKDPIGVKGGINLFVYVNNDPISKIDPFGLDIMVIENGPTGTFQQRIIDHEAVNPLGHSAVAVTDSGIYSFGNSTDLGTSAAQYLYDESKTRETDIYIIHTTPDQDRAILAYLKQFKTWKLPKEFIKDNCSTRVNHSLDAAGIRFSLAPYNLPGSAGLRALAAGAEHYHIPKGSKELPAVIGKFEPSR